MMKTLLILAAALLAACTTSGAEKYADVGDAAAWLHELRVLQKSPDLPQAATPIGQVEGIGAVPPLLDGATVQATADKPAGPAKASLWAPDLKGSGGVERTKTWCYMICRGGSCYMACMTCTTEWGGGCRITIY